MPCGDKVSTWVSVRVKNELKFGIEVEVNPGKLPVATPIHLVRVEKVAVAERNVANCRGTDRTNDEPESGRVDPFEEHVSRSKGGGLHSDTIVLAVKGARWWWRW